MNLFPAEVVESVKFVIDAEPVAQPRQHHAYSKGLGRVINYIPQSHPIHAYKALAKIRAKAAHQGPPLKEPLFVALLFLMPRPGRLIWKNKPMPRVWHTGRPDVDNLVKAMDCLTGVIWEDDAQIVSLLARKMYASGDESSKVEVFVEAAV